MVGLAVLAGSGTMGSMRRPWIRRPVLLAAGLLGLAGAAAAQSQPALHAYAVLGLESVRVGPGARVQPGAVGAMAGSVRLAASVAVPGSVVADSVRVARSTRVGRLFCRLVSGGTFGPGVVGGPTVGGAPVPGCRGLTTPIVDPALLAPVAVAPGSDDFLVPARTSSAPIPAGTFGAVTVGRGALLQLAGGSYQVRSIRLARAARLVCLDDCRIGVAEGVRLGRRAQLGAAQGLLRASGARVDIAAATDDALAFRTGPNVIVAATIFAPAGDILLGPGGDYRGAFVGRAVTVRSRGRVREDSAFPPPAR
jgi:hypothetical protein